MAQRYPAPITAAMLAAANANVAKPRYTVAGAADWSGGVKGDDIDQASAAVTLANSHSANVEADYSPRTQAAKAALPGTVPPNAVAGEPDFTLAVDVARPRGAIAPGQAYPKSGDAAPAAPVVSSISPTTGAAATLPLTVTITGTGFTGWSVVKTGGSNVSDSSARYVDATHMTVAIWAAAPGTVGVIVQDHDTDSNSVNFTVT